MCACPEFTSAASSPSPIEIVFASKLGYTMVLWVCTRCVWVCIPPKSAKTRLRDVPVKFCGYESGVSLQSFTTSKFLSVCLGVYRAHAQFFPQHTCGGGGFVTEWAFAGKKKENLFASVAPKIRAREMRDTCPRVVYATTKGSPVYVELSLPLTQITL